jgi:hypothetical protein
LRQQGKPFFFEKKNQKTFSIAGTTCESASSDPAERHVQKFFASFFQKRRIFPCTGFAD